MQLEIFPFVKESLFIESLLLVISIRIVWAQLLPDELSDFRSSPLVSYFPRRRAIQEQMIISAIETLTGSQSLDLNSVVLEQSEIRSLVLRFNRLKSSKQWPTLLLAIASLVGLFHYNRLVLLSLLFADLFIARVHYHLSSAL